MSNNINHSRSRNNLLDKKSKFQNKPTTTKIQIKRNEHKSQNQIIQKINSKEECEAPIHTHYIKPPSASQKDKRKKPH